MYSKRAGTSSIRGQLYGTKLISLLYFRAFHDDTIEHFQLAANIDNIGSFADICFKAKVNDFDKPVAVFIQTIHRENENQTVNNDLAPYFDSYLKIRKNFETSDGSLIFNGTFDETECLFVIYTTAKGDLSNDSVTSAFSTKLNYPNDTVKIDSDKARTPAGTSGTAMRPHRREENVDILCKIAMKDQVTSLAERIACFINDETNYQTMLTDELLLLYHIVLAQQVLDISEIQPDGHRMASFRHDFFDTDEEYLNLFKDKLFIEILKRRTIAPADVKNLLSQFLDEPNNATKLSKLIGTVITHKNAQLEFDKKFTKDFKLQLNKYVSRSTVNEAIELAAKDILLSRHFKVPAAFGNKDLLIFGSDEEIDRTINQLASRIIDLLKESKSCDHVVIEKSFEDGFLQLNEGIAGAIGNLFVLDENTKLMKITDNSESLGTHAKRLYKKLNEEVHNLQKYKFCFKVDKLPKLSFDCSEFEKNLARDFLKRLLFYTKQADEEGVEKHLKSEMEVYQKDYHNYFEVKTDVTVETVVVGKSIVNKNYDKIAHLYVDRRVKKVGGGDVYFKTLNDKEDDVVLVTAEPGMGKSTLLTHLSLKTKELNPEVWIMRINLLEYSKEFSKWKEEKTPIDLVKILELMCRVLLREKLGNDNNVKIALREENGVVILKDCSGDHSTEFELKLFLRFYHRGKLIFLFDGFDEICPHYTNEVMVCLKIVINGRHRTWITSRSYNEVKTVLQREFGPAYEIQNLSYMEMQVFLEQFWQYNLRLEELDGVQLENVTVTLIEYMSKLEDLKLHGFAIQLHSVYINAALYLLSEIKYKHISLWTNNKNYDYFYSKLKNYDDLSSFYEDNRDGNPLHLLLAAVFVETNIKSVSNDTVKWNLEVNGFTFFERFLETKLKTIRFEEKNEMNIYKPDIIITYDKELANFISKHKKLAAYAIFKQQSHKLFSTKDLEEIQMTIRYIENGEEKTGLIYTETNKVPRFILSEYFAVEYICDCLKNEQDIQMQKLWMDFIFNDMFSIENFMNVRNIFDNKIISDNTLMGILESNNEWIFNMLMNQGRVYAEYIVNMCRPSQVDLDVVRCHWALSDALAQQLQNLTSFFVEIIKCNINKSNLDDFLATVKDSQLLSSACRYKNDALLILVIDLVKKLDETKLNSVLLDNFPLVPHSRLSSYLELSSEDIVQRLVVCEDCIASQQTSVSSSSGFSSGPLTASIPSETSTSSSPSGPLTLDSPRRSSTSSLTSSSSSRIAFHSSTSRRRSL